MKWSFYQMKTRDRVVCLLLFILLWFIAIVCESAESATCDRAEWRSACAVGSLDSTGRARFPVGPE